MIAADLVSVFKQDRFNVIFVVLRVVLVGVLHIITYIKFPGLVSWVHLASCPELQTKTASLGLHQTDFWVEEKVFLC